MNQLRVTNIKKPIFLEQRVCIGNELGCKSAAQQLPNVFALVRFWYENS